MKRKGDNEPEIWICPGPEWPPDEETCGKILHHDGRCDGCTRRRTMLRKEAARIRRALANPGTATTGAKESAA